MQQQHHKRQFSSGAAVGYPTSSSPIFESALSNCVSSNTSLIDWDKNVVNFVYSCLYPEPRKLFAYEQNSIPLFRKSHRRIVSATTHRGGLFGYESPTERPSHPRLTRIAKTTGGHKRNVSDPGRQFYHRPLPPPPPAAPHASTIISTLEPLREILTSSFDNSCNVAYHQKDGTGDMSSPKMPYGIYELPGVESPCDDSSLESGGSDSLVGGIKTGDVEDGAPTTCLVPCLQPFANAKILLTALCAMIFVQNLVASGYLASILTTLERRFDLTTRQVGYLYASYEIAGVVSTVAFSLLGRKPQQNRPRMIGLAGLVLGLGFCLFALPHWLSGVYLPGQNVSSSPSGMALCDTTLNSSSSAHFSPPLPVGVEMCTATEATLKIGQKRLITSDYTIALPLFCFALGLAGVGSSPIFVLAPTYFWDNLPERQYPIYSGLLYTAAALGPACGFIAGASFLQIYIDTPLTPPTTSASSPATTATMDIYSQSWLGAWWMGMLVFGVLACLTSIPVIAFPSQLASNVYGERKSKLSPVPTAETTLVSTPASSCEDKQIPTKDSANEQRQVRFPGDETLPEVVNISANFSSSTCQKEVAFVPQKDCKVHRRQSSVSFKEAVSNQSNLVVDQKIRIPSRKHNWFYSSFRKPKAEVGNGNGSAMFFLVKKLGKTGEKINCLFKILWRVVTNPIWLGVTATTVFEQTIVSAFLTFAAKYFQAQFRVPAYLASIHTGGVVVPSAVLGVLTGAIMMRQFRPTISQALLCACGSIVATMATTLVLMLGLSCATNQMAGVTATYDGTPWQTDRLMYGLRPANLTAACNIDCRTGTSSSVAVVVASTGKEAGWSSANRAFSCPLTSDYNPVCWRLQPTTSGASEEFQLQQMSFFNPCLAGCSGYRSDSDKITGQVIETFTDCNCVTDASLSTGRHGGGSVTKGVCRPECPQYTVFLIITFLHIFLTSLNQNPSNVITLSCVSPEDGTVALGLQVFFTRTLAYIPAPIFFGMLMDSVCQLRANPVRSTCIDVEDDEMLQLTSLVNVEGACLEYNVQALPYVWLGGVVFFKCLSIISVFITWRSSVRLEKEKNADTDTFGEADFDANVEDVTNSK